MHVEAFNGFAKMLEAADFPPGVPGGKFLGLDVGGADVNGSVRDQLPQVTWIGLDIEAAPGVQIVADAATWRFSDTQGDPRFAGIHTTGFDIVIATELFEHTPVWRDIIATMALSLRRGGPETFIATCASTGRPPHGSRGEWGVPAGQFYGNVDPDDLRETLDTWFLDVHVEYNPNPGDAYMYAKGLR